MQTGLPTKLWPGTSTVIEAQHYSDLLERLSTPFNELLEQESIRLGDCSVLEEAYLPLAAWIAQQHAHTPLVVGINGAQGSGKSTLSKMLKMLLECGFDKSVVCLSIDDLYLSKQDREELAREVHPMLRVRGVPGTHDVGLGINILSALVSGKSSLPVTLPIFDKAQDDLLPESEWVTVSEPVDIILFEGWCVGSAPQSPEQLLENANELEQEEDAQGIWRNFVNKQLAGPYQSLFSFIDCLVMLKVPDMESIFEWRSLQEQKLRESCIQNNIPMSNVMSEQEVIRFIMFYERLTRTNLDEMPNRADVLLELNTSHQICGIRVGQ